jgi:hypothetical protein
MKRLVLFLEISTNPGTPSPYRPEGQDRGLLRTGYMASVSSGIKEVM